ncbi:hypothetical protein NA78x_002192 [Anatilimnocola sp. NA78]|uniref:hypothetical protein n=1 Tax=Anatilimnocola sp. NA78 TaxID=3415683 RepID=UPI003CE55E76
MTFRNALTSLYLLTSVYAFGGGVMQGVMNYPAWKLIGPAEFPAFHQSIDGRIFLFFVPVFFLSVPISILMIWFGHPAISRTLRVAAALLTLVIFVATLALAIPIQEKLAVTQSKELIDELILYDRYLRTIPGIFVMALNFAMLQQLMRPERPNQDQK